MLAAKHTPHSDSVHKVTIIPRGRALGITTFLPLDEKHTHSQSYCESRLCHLQGGRAAEKLIMNERTSGAANDIEHATELARKMVCEWGMSETMGPLTFGKKQEEIFLGREIVQHRDYSEKTAQLIDQEVKDIVARAAERAETIISENIHQLHALADALLEREILDGDEIDKILNGEELEPFTNKENNKPKSTDEKGKKTARGRKKPAKKEEVAST